MLLNRLPAALVSRSYVVGSVSAVVPLTGSICLAQVAVKNLVALFAIAVYYSRPGDKMEIPSKMQCSAYEGLDKCSHLAARRS
jgi:hypothetical protein